MFSKIKEALESEKGGPSQFANVMKFPAGHTYTLRLIPNLENPEKTFYHHYVNMWNSSQTGKFMSSLSLRTFGEKDPIDQLRWKEFKKWKDENPNEDNRNYKGGIQQKEQWFFNVYVIDDPANPENNGTVKILRMGPQMKEIFDQATEGVRSDELGWDIFDLEKGHDFKIVAEKQGDYTTYKNSFFTTKSKTELSEDQIEGIYENIHDLEQVYTVKSEEELKQLLEAHYFDSSVEDDEDLKPTAKKKEEVVEDSSNDDEAPFKAPQNEDSGDSSDTDDEIDELLNGLED